MAGFCGKCGAKLRDKSQFCPACGATVKKSAPAAERVLKCASCGTPLRGDEEFCGECGASVKSAVSGVQKIPPKQSEPPICPSCGAPLLTAVRFCGECGADVSSQFESLRTAGEPSAVKETAPKINKAETVRAVVNAAKAVEKSVFSAPNFAGEFELGTVSMIPNPASVISGGFKSLKLEDLDNLTVGGKYSKMIIMAVNSRYNRTLKTDKDSTQTALLDYSIKIIVDEDEEGNENAGVTTKATTKSGDKGEMGASVPSAIVLGVLATAGAGAAAAAVAGSAGSTGGGSDPSGDDGKKNGTFKMHVSKDFGDGIRRGAKPVKIRARMVEIIDGQECDRPDLNRNITITGQNMNIHGAVITGRYLEVGVSVDAACQADEAIITFLYNGKGGTFRNNIVFKVVGDPYYQFAVLSSKDKSEGYSEGPYPAAIFGDRFTYKMKFTIAETTGYPTEIKVKSLTPELEGKVVRDESVEYGYILTVVNKSRALAKPKVFVDEDKRDVEIISVFEDGTRLADKAGLSLYPEGLSVTAKTKEDRLEVQSYEQEYSAERAPRFEPKEFDINFIVKGETKSEFIMPDKADVQFKKIRGLGHCENRRKGNGEKAGVYLVRL